MFINWRRGFKMFLKSFSNCSCRFTIIYLITFYPVTLVTVYHSIFFSVQLVSLSLEATRRYLMVLPPLIYILYPMFTANVLEAFTELFSIRYYPCICCFPYFIFVVLIGVVGVIFVVVLDFNPIKSPSRIIGLSQKRPLWSKVWNAKCVQIFRCTQYIWAQRYPPVEASSHQEQYYMRSAWHFQECNWEGRLQSDIPSSDVPPGSAI